MNLRHALILPLLLASAACGRQDSRPLVGPDSKAFEASTGAVKVVVLRDTAVGTTPKLVITGDTAFNQVRVDLYRAGDTTALVGRGTTNRLGEVLFTGIAPGDYLVKLALRPKSVSSLAPGGTPVKVTAGDTTVVDAVSVRISTRITGTVSTVFTDQGKTTTIRHAGLKVLLFRETGLNTNVFLAADSTTTNAVGVYEFFVEPGPGRVQIRYNSLDITPFKEGTTLGGALPYDRKPELFIASQSVTPTTSTAVNQSPTPGRDITLQDVVFNIPARITGTIFRDRNGDGVRQATEGLIVGDTVVIRLKDSTDTKVITTTRVIASSSNLLSATFTFRSVAAGRYILRLDPLASRFPSNRLEFPAGPAYEVLVTTPTTGAVTATCRPYATGQTSTVAFGSCNFGLISGQ